MGSGSLQYGFFTDGKWNDVIAPTPSPHVKKGNDINVLTVVREGDTLSLRVNGTRAGQAPARELLGRHIGFSLSPKMAEEIDRLDVTEYAPPFVLELARATVFASNPKEYSRLAAAMYLDQSEYQKALDELLAIGDQKGAQPCYEGLAEQASAAGGTEKAVEYYLKAGSGQRVLEGLAAGYTALGKAREAESANAKLADLYLKNGKPKEALAAFLKLTKPALLSAAGERYFKDGDYDSAAALFERAGDAPALRRARNRVADRLAADGDYGAALELYRLAGNSLKADAIEKKLKALGVGTQRPEVAMCSESSGTGVSLSMIFDLSGSNVLGPKPSAVVILAQPSTELDGPFSYFFSS